MNRNTINIKNLGDLRIYISFRNKIYNIARKKRSDAFSDKVEPVQLSKPEREE